MPLLPQEEALARAQALVDKSTAAETEVTIDSVEDRFARFADTGPTQSADRERADVSIRVRLTSEDGTPGLREARAVCGSLDDVVLDSALARAMALASVAHPNSKLVPLGGPVDVPETAAQRPTMDHTFREKAQWIDHALDACRREDLQPAGLVQTTGQARAIVNSAGRAVYGVKTRAAFALTASAKSSGGGSGFADAIASNVEQIDAESVVKRAVDKAILNRSPRPIDPGEYTVVLEPSAASSLLLFASYCGFGAQDFAEKSSFLCGRVGERLFPEFLTLRDNAANDFYPGFLFDGEGTPRRAVDLIDRGTLTGPVTDARWAQELGLENTGHAVQQPSNEGPEAQNLYLSPGNQSLEQLIGGVERGLLISQFHYTNMIEPKDLTLTGMTRNGTFLIENGALTGSVRNLRFTETLVNALSRVTGIGRDLEVAGALFDGEIVCPAMRIERFRFTSTTEF